jgi:integrase
VKRPPRAAASRFGPLIGWCGLLGSLGGRVLGDRVLANGWIGRKACLRPTRNGGTMLASRPGNKGRRYPADPPRVEEIIAVMKRAGDGEFGCRLRGIIVVLWRAGLRISEALALTEGDLEIARGSVVVRGKGGRRREVGMDDWGWEQLRPWLAARVSLPIGPLFCVISGPTRGRPWSSSQVRTTLSRDCHEGWRSSAVRSASAAPCSRCRDGKGGAG